MDAGPPIPEAGLHFVLSSWSGRGQLYEALAAVSPDRFDRAWNARDVRRRANRVLWELLRPQTEQLPTTTRRWMDALPAETDASRARRATPRGRVDFVRTRLGGWPPESFVVRERHRVADELLTGVTAWTLGEVLDVASDARSVDETLVATTTNQLAAAASIMERLPLSDAPRQQPDRASLAAARRAGRPWSTVALLATTLGRHDDLSVLAETLLEPDRELRWRLFHLGVLGEVLLGIRELGHHILSASPIAGTVRGPQYRVTMDDGSQVEVWFEAAGIWRDRREVSPYVRATTGLRGPGNRPLGPDLLLIHGSKALVLECKYSADPTYVATGYEQVLAYATELGLLAGEVEALVVGPTEVVRDAGSVSLPSTSVAIVPAESIRPRVANWLQPSAIVAPMTGARYPSGPP